MVEVLVCRELVEGERILDGLMLGSVETCVPLKACDVSCVAVVETVEDVVM